MRVFDLHCPLDHVFEGWFGSEDDFRQQLERGLVECPMCGSQQLRKGLSAPRLNLGAQPQPPGMGAPAASVSASPQSAVAATPPPDRHNPQALQAAWLQLSRQIAQQTEDVGAQFPEQALRMHKGDEPARPIRGQATAQQALALLEEGVPVMPLALPKGSADTLQ